MIVEGEEHTLDPANRYAFRTLTLRNIELTPPYMHDGVFETLEEVVGIIISFSRGLSSSIT